MKDSKRLARTRMEATRYDTPYLDVETTREVWLLGPRTGPIGACAFLLLARSEIKQGEL